MNRFKSFKNHLKTFAGQLRKFLASLGFGRTSKILYFDTNAIRSLGLKTEFAALAMACKEGTLKAYVSDVVVLERGRQKYEFNITDDPSFPNTRFPEENRLDLFKVRIAAQQLLFENYQIRIIPYSKDDEIQINEIIASNDTYFTSSPNDQRDAIIFHSAIKNFSEKDVLIVCQEKKLSREFKKKGYDVHNNAKNLIYELLGEPATIHLEIPNINSIWSGDTPVKLNPDLVEEIKNLYPEYVEMLKEDNDFTELKDFLKNLADTDSELKMKILGYANVYDPIEKDNLKTILIDQKYSSDQIFNNIERLCSENLLKDTGNYYLPNKADPITKKICDQATLMMTDETIQSLGLS